MNKGHLGCFHNLVLVNSVEMNVGMEMSLCHTDLVSFGYVQQNCDCWVIW